MITRRWFPHALAAAITAPFAVWIAMSEFRGVLSPAAWLLPLAGAYYLGLRIGKEIRRAATRHADPEPTGGTRRRFRTDHEDDLDTDPEHGDR